MELLIIALLILLNGLFVAAEFSLVRVRRTRIEQLVDEGHRGARRVERLVSQPGRFLATIQIGLTFVGFLAATFAGASIVGDLTLFIEGVSVLAPQAQLVSLLLVTAVVSLFTILFGELVPKALAYAHAERLAFLFAMPIDVLGRVLSPLVWVLTSLTAAITRLFGVPDKQQDNVTAEELMILVERGSEQGVIEAEEQQMIGAVLELAQQRVHEVMVPRIDISALPASATLDEMISTIVNDGHSRIPIYDESIDNVIGILYAKDLLPLLKGGREPNLRKIVRPPLFVPESISVDDLLHQLQRQKVHIAIVLDEYGGTAGLVTIEDLIEEIVGEIQDEYDVEEPMIEALDDDRARVDGRASVDDLTTHFGLELDAADREQYDTVGGLVYHEIGGVPNVGDTVEVDGLTLTVESTDGRRVGKVLVVRRPPAGSEETEDAEAP
ncbi:MAG: magnesium and cobalt exporter, family [Chloroflexota bacterium]|jgi:putative hemolysin|nr:magnesium and cobalt exporter, family [Chloroflexota bacterium]